MGGPRRCRQGRGVELGEPALGLVNVSDQHQSPDFEVSGMRGVDPVAVGFECGARSVERLGGPAQVARDQRDLGFGNDTPRSSDDLLRTERAGSASQECFGSHELAKLRHRDASKRERWRIVAQSDPLQCAQRVARCECTRSSGDQRVHALTGRSLTPC
jgi:hypothetical protein